MTDPPDKDLEALKREAYEEEQSPECKDCKSDKQYCFLCKFN